MVNQSQWDRPLTWVLGYIVPWACALGGAWIVCAVGARLHWWEPGVMDQSIRNLVLRTFMVPLGIFGAAALPLAAWPVLRGSRHRGT